MLADSLVVPTIPVTDIEHGLGRWVDPP